MLVFAIATILLAVGIPSFQDLIRNYRISTMTNEFFAAIQLARSEAIYQGKRVDLVPLDGRDWATGWAVFVDENNNQTIDAQERVVYSHGPVMEGVRIKSLFTDSTKPYLAYNGAGRTRTNSNSETPQFGTVSLFLDKKIRRIKINFLGRARICNPENDNACTGAMDAS